eukprot:5571753-Pyramimonas_sp.AAC.1
MAPRGLPGPPTSPKMAPQPPKRAPRGPQSAARGPQQSPSIVPRDLRELHDNTSIRQGIVSGWAGGDTSSANTISSQWGPC